MVGMQHHPVARSTNLPISRSITSRPGARNITAASSSTPPSTMAHPPAPKVAVITTAGCKFCRAAKAALSDAGIPFQEVDVSERLAVLEALKAATGQRTVPQVFVAGQLIGGTTELVPLLQDGSFRALVDAAEAAPLPQDVQRVLEAEDVKNEAAPSDEPATGPSEVLIALAAALGTAQPTTARVAGAAAWLEQQQGVDEAVTTLAEMQAAQLITLPGSGPDTAVTRQLLAASPSQPLRVVATLPLVTSISQPLNSHFTWFGPARPATVVSQHVRQLVLKLYDTHMAPDGRRVNYRGMAADPAFRQFVDASAELQRVEVSTLTAEEALCFWINIYNSVVVHAIAVAGPATDTLSRLRWFESVSYLIDGRRFSCNDIEHGVLRGNAASPASLLSLLGQSKWAPRTFRSGDPRAALALKQLDPRIHFALNCGALSCPPIRVYTPERLEVGLASAAAAFVAGEVAVDVPSRTVTLSMILKWYGPDFGPKPAMLRFLLPYLPESTKADLEAVLAAGGPDCKGVKLQYKPYDWGVNAVEED